MVIRYVTFCCISSWVMIVAVQGLGRNRFDEIVANISIQPNIHMNELGLDMSRSLSLLLVCYCFRRFKPSIVESTALCRRPPLVFVGFRCGAEYKDNVVAVDICNLMRHVVWFQMRSLTRVRVRLLEVLPVVLCCSKSCHCCRRLHFPVSRPRQIRILVSNSFVIVRWHFQGVFSWHPQMHFDGLCCNVLSLFSRWPPPQLSH